MKEIIYAPFPLYGYTITDTYEETDFSMFGNASVVSGSALKQFLASLPSHQQSSGSALVWSGQIDDELAYVLVRTFGNTPEERAEMAAERAIEVASVLFLSLLARTYMHESASLGGQVNQPKMHTLFMVSSVHGLARFQSGIATREFIHTIPDPPIAISQQRLRQFLDHPTTRALTAAVLDCSKSVVRATRRTLGQMCSLLYEAANSQLPETQLLGAVTVFDWMSSYQGDARIGWRQQELHLKAMVGPERFALLKPLLGVRHGYVHRGTRCTAGDAYQAIRLASSALMAYATLAPSYGGHNEFVRHLEFTTRIEGFPDPRYAPARALAIDVTPAWPDTLWFDIARFIIGARGLDLNMFGARRADVPDDEMMAFKQADAILSAAALTGLDLQATYEGIMEALTYEAPAWDTYEAFVSFYDGRRDQLDAEVARSVEVFRQYESFGLTLSGRA